MQHPGSEVYPAMRPTHHKRFALQLSEAHKISRDGILTRMARCFHVSLPFSTSVT
jgi:hypothetical protein